MAWASQSGRARTSASDPRAFGVCQRCGIWYNRENLQNQMAWRGAAMLPTWLFVCPHCYDTPQQNGLRAIVIPADPMPVQLALPENFDAASADYMGLTAGATVDPKTGIPVPGKTAMSTTSGVVMGPTPVGRPVGYSEEPLMPLVLNTEGTQPVRARIPIPVTSIMSDGSPVVRVTCPVAHNLVPNQQVAVQGTLDPKASGIFSVSPLTATVFSYGCFDWIEAGSQLEPNTLVMTA